MQKAHINHAVTAFELRFCPPYLRGPDGDGRRPTFQSGVAVMATTFKAQTAPFGAISSYKLSSALFGVAENVLAWNARRSMAAEFRALSPRELEDIGLTAVATEPRREGIVARAAGWIRGKIDAYRTAKELSRLSPRMLDDIGLTLADVDRARERASFF